MKKAILLAATLLIFQADVPAQRPVIFSAMKDELARSMEQLKLQNEAGPYYLSYTVKDVSSLRITGDSGAIVTNQEGRRRILQVDLRVGSYAQDSSNFLSLSNLMSSVSSSLAMLSLDDDYEVLRRQIWIVTDSAYKGALERLAKKKATLENVVQSESIPDFTKGTAISSTLPEVAISAPKPRLIQMVDQLCRLFLDQPKIPSSKVDLRMQAVNSYYVNSEGTTAMEPSSAVRLSVSATTQADDGMPHSDYLVYTATRPEGLPGMGRLGGDIKTLISGLLAARTAPVADDYSGPVLFAGEAAGELFGQGLVSFLGARKVPVADSPSTNAMLARMMQNPFLTKLNTKVASAFLSVKAVPALDQYLGTPILGSFWIDDEGSPCRGVSLIDNGMLKDLLTTRSPVKGLPQTNGYFRGGTAQPGVIQVTSAKKVAATDLKQELISALKEEGLPFGYMVKAISPLPEAADPDNPDLLASLVSQQQGPPEPSQFKLTRPTLVIRIYADGKEELVRGAEFGSLSVNVFKNVLATSDDEFVYNYLLGQSRQGGGTLAMISSLASIASGQDYYATVITPSMLVSGIDLKKSTGPFRKPPIVGYPGK